MKQQSIDLLLEETMDAQWGLLFKCTKEELTKHMEKTMRSANIFCQGDYLEYGLLIFRPEDCQGSLIQRSQALMVNPYLAGVRAIDEPISVHQHHGRFHLTLRIDRPQSFPYSFPYARRDGFHRDMLTQDDLLVLGLDQLSRVQGHHSPQNAQQLIGLASTIYNTIKRKFPGQEVRTGFTEHLPPGHHVYNVNIIMERAVDFIHESLAPTP